MATIKIDVSANYREAIVIGRQRENEVMRIDFDVGKWILNYGLGTVTLSVQRQIDSEPYPIVITIDQNGIASWEITDVETIKAGQIKAQLTYYVGTKKKKSNIYILSVKESLAENGQAPDPYESWLEVLQELTAETAANAQTASEAAESASTSAASAAESAEASAASAISASTSATAANASAMAAQTAETNAEEWAELAQQVATDNGYAQMYIDDDGTLYLARTTNIVDKLDFDLTSDGELEVLIYG